MYKLSLAKCSMVCVVILLMITSACVPYSKLKYFNDIDELSEPVVNPMKSVTISPFDKLHIIVLSTDEQTADLLNSSSSGQGSAENIKPYVVDEAGNISFPFVGKIQVGGMTLIEAGDQISKNISSIITKPVVLVNFLYNKITVMGEVVNQGTYQINENFINIYESLALGGGLTEYADRKKVILLRNDNNKLMYYKLDLTTSKISTSPLYYILPNDIIIIEPLRARSFNYQNSMITTFLGALTAILSIFYISSISRSNPQ